LKQSRAVRFPDVTYSFYPVYCRLLGIDHEAVPLDAEMRVSVGDYLDHDGPVIVANPNAPTGIAIPRAEIARLARGRPEAAVVVDEAYVDFGAESAIPLIRDCPNLLVVQTMSKSRALAGLRVGYAIGDVALVEALTRVKDSFNSYPLDRLAEAGAIASLEDEEYFQRARAAVMRNRDDMTADLIRLGFDVLPSSANFVFARHARHSGEALAAALRQRAVLVRHFAAPRISDYLRITVGAEPDLARLKTSLSEILGEIDAG
jgi:histidinol-phosphate aminotransferase